MWVCAYVCILYISIAWSYITFYKTFCHYVCFMYFLAEQTFPPRINVTDSLKFLFFELKRQLLCLSIWKKILKMIDLVCYCWTRAEKSLMSPACCIMYCLARLKSAIGWGSVSILTQLLLLLVAPPVP